jgi:peptide chain release factor 2
MDKDQIQKKIDEIGLQMAKPDFWVDKEKAHQSVEEYNQLKKQLELLKSKPEFFNDEYDMNNCFINISAGTGGTEACDWAEMLMRMYLRFCEKKGFKTEILDKSVAEEAGIKNAFIKVDGAYSYGYLKVEQGVHRLVRISPFNADKARHTSFALVEVVPEIDNPKIDIDEKDLRIDVYRSGGHGGQSVNTTDSAVRITHSPTGLVVTCQNERSQLQNKESAMKVLKSRITQLMEKEHIEKIDDLKSKVVGTQWGSQIRNYVLNPYTLVKDTRSNWSSANVQSVLNGELEDVIMSVLKLNNK